MSSAPANVNFAPALAFIIDMSRRLVLLLSLWPPPVFSGLVLVVSVGRALLCCDAAVCLFQEDAELVREPFYELSRVASSRVSPAESIRHTGARVRRRANADSLLCGHLFLLT
jgi:hypothetical protein